ncbi:hypothetical protein BGZ65_006842 [Modicella reniformis]|uniref:Uncharacterized protein n=1 Tax=Modicella reniformis TaxID=1440133 RepID=A0A9P6IJM7_9FUNG|nr:hypothetical protein BGZ65_006842 [Modicella reniformis]
MDISSTDRSVDQDDDAPSVVQDDTPPAIAPAPPTLFDSSGSDSSDINTPSSISSTSSPSFPEKGSNIANNSSSVGIGSGNGSGRVDLEVNSTIQTILITVGVCVGALVLIGLIATRFISHKNKVEGDKVLEVKGAPGPGAGNNEKLGVSGEDGNRKLISRRASIVTVQIDDRDIATASTAATVTTRGIGISLSDIIGRTKSRSNSASTTIANSPNGNSAANSPKRSNIIGGVGKAVGGATGSFQMGASGPRVGPGSVNPRNSIMHEVGDKYGVGHRPSIPTPPTIPIASTTLLTSSSKLASALRAATPGYSQEHPHLHVPAELQLRKFSIDEDPMGLSTGRSYDWRASRKNGP